MWSNRTRIGFSFSTFVSTTRLSYSWRLWTAAGTDNVVSPQALNLSQYNQQGGLTSSGFFYIDYNFTGGAALQLGTFYYVSVKASSAIFPDQALEITSSRSQVIIGLGGLIMKLYLKSILRSHIKAGWGLLCSETLLKMFSWHVFAMHFFVLVEDSRALRIDKFEMRIWIEAGFG